MPDTFATIFVAFCLDATLGAALARVPEKEGQK